MEKQKKILPSTIEDHPIEQQQGSFHYLQFKTLLELVILQLKMYQCRQGHKRTKKRRDQERKTKNNGKLSSVTPPQLLATKSTRYELLYFEIWTYPEDRLSCSENQLSQSISRTHDLFWFSLSFSIPFFLTSMISLGHAHHKMSNHFQCMCQTQIYN